MTAAVEAVNVSKSFGDFQAVKTLSLDIEPGQFFSLLGPSGCGKTTLLRMIAGFETPSTGNILVGGKDMTRVPAHKRPVNMVFQSYALFPHLTVSENVAFGLKVTGECEKADIAGRVKEALKLVRLDQFSERYPSQLSGGQQQRVALARSVVKRPQVLLLDEPLSALDLKIRQEMQEELNRLQEELGITFIMVTHDQGEALALSCRIAVFYQGHMEQVGTPEEIYEQPKTAFVASFIGQTNLIDGKIVEKQGSLVLVEIAPATRLLVRDVLDNGPSNVGDSVYVVLRTQAPKLLGVDGVDSLDHHNSLQAIVEQKSYQGHTTDYWLRLSSGLRIKVCQNNDGQHFVVGDTVKLVIPTDSAYVLPDGVDNPKPKELALLR